MASEESIAELNHTLTVAARSIAEQEGVTLKRHVRTVAPNSRDHDLEVHKEDNVIYVKRNLPAHIMLKYLKRGVLLAAQVDKEAA